jgi:carbonic anhydrase
MLVDPAHVLGIKPGGRHHAEHRRTNTPGLLEQLGLLGRIGQVVGEIPGGGGEFHLIVLQHADSGITRLSGDPALLTRYFPRTQGQIGLRSSDGGCSRRRCASGGSDVAERLADLRPHL